MNGDGDAAGGRAGWLRILHDEGDRWAYCPYRSRVLGASECFACKDCAGLAIDAARDDHVVCARAERDGLSTSLSRGDGDDGVVHFQVAVHARPREPDET